MMNEVEKILAKYPGRVPILVTADRMANFVLTKNKFLVPDDCNFGHFMYVLRKRIKLPETVALFFFINNKLPTSTEMLKSIYQREKDADGFLRVTVKSESTFG